MARNRTPQRPLFDVMRPSGAAWTWVVTYKVASSGYVWTAHVEARREAERDVLLGTAECSVSIGDPLNEVLEMLAVEAMLAACEPSLFGSISHRRCDFRSTTL